MKNKRLQQAAVFLCISALMATTATAAGGSVAYNTAGLIHGFTQVVRTGQGFTAPDGQTVPSVITYTDAAGGKTNYLSVRQIAGLIDTPVSWDAGQNSVVLGANPYAGKSADERFEPVGTGVKIGPFTEIDPSSIVEEEGSRHAPIAFRIVSSHATGSQKQTMTFLPGSTAVISVTNNGKDNQIMYVSWTAPGSIYANNLVPVMIGPGQTVTRAFQADADANPLSRELNWRVQGESGGEIVPTGTDISVSITNYTPAG